MRRSSGEALRSRLPGTHGRGPSRAAAASESGGARDVNWYVFNEPGGGYEGAIAKCNKQNAGKFKINYVKLPTDADQQRELIVRRLAAKDSDIGIIGMDVNWTAEFAEAEWIVPWEGANEQAATEDRIPALLQAAEYEDKIWAAPFTTNTQLLWYHKDVVKGEPPQTWDEMIDQAKQIGPREGQGRRPGQAATRAWSSGSTRSSPRPAARC